MSFVMNDVIDFFFNNNLYFLLLILVVLFIPFPTVLKKIEKNSVKFQKLKIHYIGKNYLVAGVLV
jgi:hypothetical protein